MTEQAPLGDGIWLLLSVTNGLESSSGALADGAVFRMRGPDGAERRLFVGIVANGKAAMARAKASTLEIIGPSGDLIGSRQVSLSERPPMDRAVGSEMIQYPFQFGAYEARLTKQGRILRAVSFRIAGDGALA